MPSVLIVRWPFVKSNVGLCFSSIQALLAEAKERLAKEEKLPDRAPVWKMRTEPPAMFHQYQTLTVEEWEEEFEQRWGMAESPKME